MNTSKKNSAKVEPVELQRNDIFRGFDAIDLLTVARCARRQVFPCHSVLDFKLGKRPCLYLVEAGTLAVYCDTDLPVKEEDGKYLLCLRSRQNVMIGEFILAGHEMPKSSVETINECQLVAIPIATLHRFAKDHPRIYKRLFDVVVKKLVAERRHAEAIQLESEKESVCLAQTILNLADEFGTNKDGKIQCYIDVRCLCGYTSEKQRTLENKMFVLEKKFHLIWFSKERGEIVIRDRLKLEEFVKVRHSARIRRL